MFTFGDNLIGVVEVENQGRRRSCASVISDPLSAVTVHMIVEAGYVVILVASKQLVLEFSANDSLTKFHFLELVGRSEREVTQRSFGKTQENCKESHLMNYKVIKSAKVGIVGSVFKRRAIACLEYKYIAKLPPKKSNDSSSSFVHTIKRRSEATSNNIILPNLINNIREYIIHPVINAS